MIHIQERKSPWEVAHMDWVRALPPSGDRSYNASLVILYRYSKTPIFLPCHKNDTAMDTALLLFSRDISHTALFENIVKFQDSDGFTHDWCTLIPALELAYKTSVHSSTGKTTAMLEKGWNPRLQADTLRKELIDIHPTDSSFKLMLDKVKNHAKKSMNEAFDYAKQKWDKSYEVPYFKLGDLFLVSTLDFNNIKGPKNTKILI
ncbi:hypothetical protein O181_003903 [Austropuccinia psidii MF-1]|uniref:Uncharacterized protein n=1 Tax=Austropuccinia psidii MF-1 TaxID=1389203 RepID=A0A9Q3BFK1_9BASI|nr:hypothetical protein [Austropuccinia psidii MF-1]